MRRPGKKLISHGFPNETILPLRRRATWPMCARRRSRMFGSNSRTALGLGAALAAVLVAGAAAAQENATPVAMVNGAPITRAELDGAFRQARISDQADRMPAAEVNKIKLHILQLLINRTLLNQHLNDLKVKVDEK